MINRKNTTLDNSSWIYDWSGFKENDVGDHIETIAFSNISAQISGDILGGSHIKFECSNDLKNWHEMSDKYDNLISVDEHKMVSLPIDYLCIRPVFVGESNEGVNVTIFGKGKK